MRAESTIGNIIKKQRKDLDQLKTTQFAGASDVVLYVNQTADLWDITFTLADGEKHIATIDTHFDTPFPLIDMSVIIYMDGTDFSNIIEQGDIGFEFAIGEYLRDPLDPTYFKIDLTLVNFDLTTHTFYIKLYFTGTT